MGKTLLQKVWDLHTVRQLPSGQTQLFIGLHLVHEVTTPQAFDELRANGWKVARPDRTFATTDHIIPTKSRQRPFLDVMAEDMLASLERNVRDYGIRYAGLDDDRQGIVHVIGPELGLTQPGMTIACGDSHTSTHGAFGAVAFGIGTSQVRDVLASQCLAMEPLKVRRIEVRGRMGAGVYAKDVILTIIRRLGVNGGVGFAYEYAGAVRDIHLKDPGPAPVDSWMGQSVAKWDGDTLVVDVTGLNDQTWFDRAGNFHSDALHVVERYTRTSADVISYEATIEDPNVFTRPWKMSMPLYRRQERNAQLMDFKCVEFVEELMYGQLRKKPLN